MRKAEVRIKAKSPQASHAFTGPVTKKHTTVKWAMRLKCNYDSIP